jgi:MFS family permease
VKASSWIKALRSGALPPAVWALGFASMLMDTSSELIHSLLPAFMTGVLGASVVTVGLVEGVAEAATSVTKLFSGSLSDLAGRRKPLVVLGYLLAAVTKPAFALASSVGWVVAARFIDRVGKGIREAPRDALLADITPPPVRGAAYGLRQSLDSVGAFCGPLLAVLLMAGLSDNIRAAMWGAVIPGFATVVVLVLYVREPDARQAAAHSRPSLIGIRRLPGSYWLAVLLGALFTLARFSDAFLVLRALNVGLAVRYVPLVMISMNIAYAACAYPAGAAADHASPRLLLGAGVSLLFVANIVLAAAASATAVFAACILWGLQMAATQGLFGKLIADAAPEELRGTAFGVFNLFIGLALIIASPLAGALWSAVGPPAAFAAGALFAGLCACVLLAWRPSTPIARGRPT